MTAPVTTRAALSQALAALPDGRVALVPTMGNLHEGHLSLVRIARKHADRVVVSIFVNPTQFGPGEDYESYPRTLDQDLERLAEASCDVVFAPGVSELYPFGTGRSVRVQVPEVSSGLCGAARPGHFEGVATVVLKLFTLVGPDVAVFGEKDYQQLLVVRRLVTDLGLPIDIVGAPIVREADGLAMSSRNLYLDDKQRARAPVIFRTLQWLRDAIQTAGSSDDAALAAARRRLLEAELELEYLELRRAADLQPAGPDDEHLVALVAVRLGPARLIDNLRFSRSP